MVFSRRIGTLLSVVVLTCAVLSAQSNPVPLINNPLVPDAVAPGSPGFSLTVNGTGFVSGAIVSWNGSARSTTFVSSSRLTVTILASDIATAGTASVTVKNPGNSVNSAPAFFSITKSSVSVTLVSPSSSSFLGSILSVASGDFNDDGKLDLVVGLNSFNVDVLLGKGDGTFQSPVQYATDGTAGAVTTGDFNGDGALDLAVATLQGVISVLLGNGDGTFQAPVNTTTSIPGVAHVLTADFDEDGKLDLAILTASTISSVSILRGNGDGTFQSPSSYTAGIYASSFVTGDFNGDDKLDLAATCTETKSGRGGDIGILLGNGDGTFQKPYFYRVGLNPQSLVTADLNGDGSLDLVAANGGQNSISVLLGKGDGSFQRAVGYLTGMNPLSVVAADFNSDGKLDVATVDFSRETGKSDLSILLGNGDGTFQPRLGFADVAGYALLTGDFNGDGKPDLASAPAGGISIFVQK